MDRTGGLSESLGSQRAIAWQVGRRGEAACGMTQVVNGYLQWKFKTFDTDVITSREEPRGFLHAGLLFLRALLRTASLHPRHAHVCVVHLSQGGSFVREGALLVLARWRGLGTVAHLHGSRFVAFAGRHPRLVGSVLAAAHRIIVLSNESQDAVVRLLPDANVALIPNAVQGGRRRVKERLVVFGGSVCRRKGVDLLIEAWRQVGVGSDWRLVIAGPVDEPGVLPEIPEGCTVTGAINHSDLMALLERSMIAVLPSRNEAMPMFILEAMARRNCVVSTAVGGIPAVLTKARGVLVEPDRADLLAAALQALMHDDARREAVATRAQRCYDEHYSAAAVYPRVEKLWAEALPRPLSVA